MSHYNHNKYKIHDFDEDHEDRTKLPALNIALYPNDAWFSDDISDKTLFNERFIEDRSSDKAGNLGLYSFMAAHNFFLFIILESTFGFFAPPRPHSSLFEFFIDPAVIFYIITIVIIYFLSTLIESAPIRFNRQAQLVHCRWNDDICLSLPWREVSAFSVRKRKGPFSYYELWFYFPLPKHIDLDINDDDLQSLPILAMFSEDDSLWMFTNMQRYEFIRRYMEVGLSAIQPDKEQVEKNRVRKPSGMPEAIIFPFFAESKAVIILNKFLSKLLHLLVFGPLIDWWVERKISRFQWPEEIERLCAEGADLSAFDTTPIKAQTDTYYRYNAGVVAYVGRNGYKR